MEINIKVGKHSFAAELFDNPGAHSFKALLPFTIVLKDLNQNEKCAEIPGDLKVRPVNPYIIEAGDLMLYESNTIVLFYKFFSTLYSYTSLGLFTFLVHKYSLPCLSSNSNASDQLGIDSDS